MKKNKMMRLASVLLIAVLMSTCAISGTFAKYVTSDSATDTARVAKFGVKIVAENNTLFLKDYAKEDDNFTGTYSVSSGTGDKDFVLAPGTQGKLTEITLAGTPEVAVDVKFVATMTLSDNWLVEVDEVDKFYCPVVFTIGTETVSGLDYDNADGFIAAVEEKIEAYSAKYDPNKDLSEITNGTAFDISWKWLFEGDNSGEKIKQTDVYDTVLGDAAALADLNIGLKIDITVTQID